ncbi:hypothetical protein ABH15_02570 [Methanoculleus taiwanensis]|uniref:Uncharacterized protein n=1 Tax=Methanoculleus taiwanensis TaxID=1550565 RepID=A0A498H4C7_9EURY|nr:hypothetical protein [Methanoculleus taiwanensis]RXE57035.1 hypothetical protein ABH15_02570 [Methanoculleus taiwanensis]
MPIPIRILMKGTTFDAELFDTACAGEIGRVLPLDAARRDCDKRGELRRVWTIAPSRQVP